MKRFFHKRQLTFWGWLVVVLAGLMGAAVLTWPDKKLHVIMCDVGQGDAILVEYGDKQVLIDGGPGDAVVDCLSRYLPFWDREIELLVMTNGDSDHMTGLIEVVKRYEVGQMVANNLVQETEKFKVFRQAVLEDGIEVYAPKEGDVIRVGAKSMGAVKSELIFKVLWPEARLGDSLVWNGLSEETVLGMSSYSKSKANEQSVVLNLQFGDFEMLMAGDVGEVSEQVMVGRGLVDDVDVLKVGHHGSKHSSSSTFLSVVRPELALVSSGKNNYGHPSREALTRLEAAGARVLRTDELGDIELVSDGASYWIK